MAKVNGWPQSVQSGIPKKNDVPNGWESAPLGKYLYEIKRPAILKDKYIYKLVTVKRNRGGAVERSQLYGKEVKTKTQFFVKKGDFLISKRQIVHGACALVPKELDGAVVSNEYSTLGGIDGLDLMFLNCLAETVYFQQTCFHSSVGVHVEKMIFKVDGWLKWNFNFPPLDEQKKIVKIISSWDRAITILKELIENSRKQKKALIQQLLTGEKRFKKFEGEKWHEVKLSEIAEIVVSNVDKKINDNELPVKLCNYTDVYYNEYITNDVDFMKATAKPEEIKKFTLRKGDVLITKDSESPDDIAIPALVNEEIIGVLCGYHLAIVRPYKDVSDGGFISCLFALSRIRYHFGTLANGATRFGLPLGAIKNAKFLIPSLQEQNKIAEFIEGINNEIQNLVSQENALNIQKKALMQQLLTGKRRVVTDNPIPQTYSDLCEVTG